MGKQALALDGASNAAGATSTVGWIFVLGGLGLGAYYLLFRPKPAPPARTSTPGQTVAKEPASTLAPAPSSFKTLAEVQKRFDEVRELYRMGRLAPEEAQEQALELFDVATDMASAGTAPTGEALALGEQISVFLEGIEEYLALPAA